MNHKHIIRFSSHESDLTRSLCDEWEEKDSNEHDNARNGSGDNDEDPRT